MRKANVQPTSKAKKAPEPTPNKGAAKSASQAETTASKGGKSKAKMANKHVYTPDPVVYQKERPLTPDEERIVAFLEMGLAETLTALSTAARATKFGTANDCQTRALTLRTVIDTIRMGAHDADHPTRVIDPREMAQRFFHTA